MAQPTTTEVLDVIADEYALNILTETEQEAKSAKDLTETCDASETTVYRRIERLKSHGLIKERLEIDRNGHHRKLYNATLEGLSINVEDGSVTVTVETQDDVADRFGQMWGQMRND